MSEASDERIGRAISGDVPALTSLLREFGPPLRDQLSIDKRWQGVLDADDIMQVTYLEAFLQIGTFVQGGPNAFPSWLRRIAENNLRDAVRALGAAKRPPPAVSAPLADRQASIVALFEHLGVDSGTPSAGMAAGEREAALLRALEALPADYAIVIRKYDLDGLGIAEVAAAIGRSPGAVHMLRARAHDWLREFLGPGGRYFSHSP